MSTKQLLHEAQKQLAWYMQSQRDLRTIFTAFVLGNMKLIGLHTTPTADGVHRAAVMATLDHKFVLILFRKYLNGETNPGGSELEWEHFTFTDFMTVAADAHTCAGRSGIDITPEWRQFLMGCADLLLHMKGASE